MAAEESLIHLLYLFDSFWFDNQILKKNSNQPFVSKLEDDNDQPKLARIYTRDDQDDDKSIMIMSSQESLISGDSDNLLSPNSVLMIRSPVKLETILSNKESGEVPEEEPLEKQEEKKVNINSSDKINNRKRWKRKGSKGGLNRRKTLSELEFEEVKGFMDLGFVFSEGDKNSSLVKIIPGLQRFGKQQQEKEKEHSINKADSLRRPYLSQAWEIMEFGRNEHAEKLKYWRISAAVSNEIDMKHKLRFWAHSVASAVK